MGNNLQLEKAVDACKVIFNAISSSGFYPALTGGSLYRDGPRKDVDIVIFRNRQNVDSFEISDIEQHLAEVGFSEFSHFGFVTKCKYKDLKIDLFNPETSIDFSDEYGVDND